MGHVVHILNIHLGFAYPKMLLEVSGSRFSIFTFFGLGTFITYVLKGVVNITRP